MYNNLCLGGGGIKVISFLGVLKYLKKYNYFPLKNFNKLVGVSAGSIICFLLNIGYTINELEEFVLNFHFNKLLPESNTENLLFHYGLGTTEKLKTVLILLLKNKLQQNDISFEQLYQKTKVKLQIGITNLNTNKFELWDYQLKPKLSIIEAVSISCNLPFVFRPVKFNKEFLIDGGILNNFPINYFENNELTSTIGICCNNNKNHTFDNIFEYISKVFSMVTSNKDKIRIEQYKNNVDIIEITAKDNTLDFEINSEVIKKRINFGYQQAKKFFSNKKINKRRNSI